MVASVTVARSATNVPVDALDRGGQERNVPSMAPDTEARRVLIVDDSIEIAELTAEALRELGHEVRIAHDGNAALATAADFKPDVALLDLGLPSMDGYSLCRKMRSAGLVPRLIALTGYSQPDDKERTRSAGFELHLVKPVDLDVLHRAVVGTEGAPSR